MHWQSAPWQQLPCPPQRNADSLAFLPYGNYVFAGTDDGVFVRGSGDQTMHLLSTGLPAVPVFALALDADAGKLYAGTHGRGVWALDLDDTPYITDDQGRLVADKAGVYTGKPLVWGCLGGRCAGDTGQSQCMSAPVVQATIACGTMSGTVQLGSPLARIDPPSAFFTLDPDMNAAHPAYTLTLAARLRDAGGTPQTLCTVAHTFTPGTMADQIVTALGQDVNADRGCIAAGVTATVTTAGSSSGGADPRAPRNALSLSAPGRFGRQLFPEVRGATYGLLQVDGMGLPVSQEDEAPMVTFAVPAPGGAAGGSVTITETTQVGRWSYTVPTHAGDTADVIASNAAAMFDSGSNDGSCRDAEKARDLLVANLTPASANAVFAAGNQVSVQSADPNVTVTLGPSGW